MRMTRKEKEDLDNAKAKEKGIKQDKGTEPHDKDDFIHFGKCITSTVHWTDPKTVPENQDSKFVGWFTEEPEEWPDEDSASASASASAKNKKPAETWEQEMEQNEDGFHDSFEELFFATWRDPQRILTTEEEVPIFPSTEDGEGEAEGEDGGDAEGDGGDA